MQHQYWITKQTLSQKFGRKEDECIVSSDAQLDAKLELFNNIQISCLIVQNIINKYQESVSYLSQEINSMGRFLKENTNEHKKHGNILLNIGKSLIFCAQQQLVLHEPLIRFYKELETFRQRAVEDTLQNVLVMEKARTEYRAALSWMKNVSQQLDPDTTKQLEKFKKVQHQVRSGKKNFDKHSFDCLQKIDLLAAARCNMFNHTLTFYHNKLMNYVQKSAIAYSTTSDDFENQYENETFTHNDIKNELQFLENERSLLDNIIKESNIFEKLIDENYPTICELKNSIEPNKFSSLYCDNRNSESLLQSHTKKYNENLDSVRKSEYKKSDNEISNTDLSKHFNMSKYNCGVEDNYSFLPSTLLKQNLENAINKSRIHKNNDLINNIDLSKKIDNSRSWMNLFEELDPLSNSLNESYTKQKNSFV